MRWTRNSHCESELEVVSIMVMSRRGVGVGNVVIILTNHSILGSIGWAQAAVVNQVGVDDRVIEEVVDGVVHMGVPRIKICYLVLATQGPQAEARRTDYTY